jgi:hypothetical protein
VTLIYYIADSSLHLSKALPKLANRLTGDGFTLYQSGKQFLQSSFPLGLNKEVFDAEAEAALAGVKAALGLYTAQLATNLWVCLDNLEVGTRLLAPFTGSSQEGL